MGKLDHDSDGDNDDEIDDGDDVSVDGGDDAHEDQVWLGELDQARQSFLVNAGAHFQY